MFQPVEAFFLSDTLENTFLKCLNTIYVEGAYTRTLNFESGPASENNLESGKVTRGHRNLRSWPKKIPEILLSWPFNFFIYVNTNLYQKYQKMTRNIKKSFSCLRIWHITDFTRMPLLLKIIPYPLYLCNMQGYY